MVVPQKKVVRIDDDTGKTPAADKPAKPGVPEGDGWSMVAKV